MGPWTQKLFGLGVNASKSVWRWWKWRPSAQIARSIRAACIEHGTDIEDLEPRLREFLNHDRREQLVRLSHTARPNIEQLAEEFQREQHIVSPIPGRAEKLCLGAIGTLVSALRVQQASSPKGSAVVERLNQDRFEQLANSIGDSALHVAQRSKSETLRLFIRRLEDLHRKLTPREGLSHWRLLLEIAETSCADAPTQAHIHARIGLFLWQLGDNRPASGSLDRAFILDPDSPRSMRSKALSLALAGAYSSAQELVTRAIVLEPNNPANLTFKCLFHLWNREFDLVDAATRATLMEPISEDNVDIFRIAANASLDRGDHTKATSLLEKVVAHTTPIPDDFLGYVASLLLPVKLDHRQGRFNPRHTDRIRRAQQMAERAAQGFRQRNQPTMQARAELELGFISTILDERSKAIEHLRSAIVLAPSDTTVISHASNGLIIHGLANEGNAALLESFQTKADERIAELIFQSTSASTLNDSVATIRSAFESEWNSKMPANVYVEYLQALRRLGRAKHALTLIEHDPPDGSAFERAVLRASVLAEIGRTNEAFLIVEEQLEKPRESQTDSIELLRLATLCARFGRFDLAVRAYDEFGITPTTDDGLLANYLSAVLQAEDPELENRALYLALSEPRSAVKTRAAAYVYAQRDNLRDAYRCFEEVIKTDETRPRDLVEMASYAQRLGEPDVARARCVDALRQKLAPEDLVDLAGIQLNLGDEGSALAIAIRALEAAPDDPQIQIRYFTIFLQSEKRLSEKLSRTVARAGDIVRVQDGTCHYLGSELPFPELVTCRPGSPQWKQLLNAAAETDVTWDGTAFRVIEVLSKESYGFQRCRGRLSANPDSGLRAVAVPKDPAELEKLVQGPDLTQSIDVLKKYPTIPQATVARLLSVLNVEVRDCLRELGIPIFLPPNTQESRQRADTGLRDRPRLVLDINGILRLAELQLLKVAQRYPIAIVQHSYDTMCSELQELEFRIRSKGGTLAKTPTGLTYVPYSPAADQRRTGLLREAIATVDQFGTKLGRARSLVAQESRGLGVFGDAAMDALTIVENSRGTDIFITDEALIAEFFRERQFSTATTLDLAYRAHADNGVSDKILVNAVVFTVRSGFRSIPITSDVLLMIVSQKLSCDDYFCVLDYILSPDNDPTTSRRLVVLHLASLVLHTPLWLAIESHVVTFFEATSKNLGAKSVGAIVKTVDQILQLDTPNKRALVAQYETWAARRAGTSKPR